MAFKQPSVLDGNHRRTNGRTREGRSGKLVSLAHTASRKTPREIRSALQTAVASVDSCVRTSRWSLPISLCFKQRQIHERLQSARRHRPSKARILKVRGIRPSISELAELHCTSIVRKEAAPAREFGKSVRISPFRS